MDAEPGRGGGRTDVGVGGVARARASGEGVAGTVAASSGSAGGAGGTLVDAAPDGGAGRGVGGRGRLPVTAGAPAFGAMAPLASAM
jgi:hypothetical protein